MKFIRYIITNRSKKVLKLPFSLLFFFTMVTNMRSLRGIFMVTKFLGTFIFGNKCQCLSWSINEVLSFSFFFPLFPRSRESHLLMSVDQLLMQLKSCRPIIRLQLFSMSSHMIQVHLEIWIQLVFL